MKISFNKEQVIKMNKSASRKAEIELGMMRNTHRVHKTAKNYNRKNKSYKLEY